MATYEISKSEYGSNTYEFKDAKSRDATTDLVDICHKNKLRFDNATAGSFNGLSYVVDTKAGTITVSGTKTTASSASYAVFRIHGSETVYVDEFCDGNHVLSGCPSGGGTSTYSLYVAKSSYTKYDYGSGVTLDSTSTTGIQVIVYIAANYSIPSGTSLVFKPMICTKAAWELSQEFVPYDDHIEVLQELDANGTKNHLLQSSGSNSAGSSWIELPVKVPAGKYVVSFENVTSTDTDANWCRGRFHAANGDGVSSYFSVGRGDNISAEVTVTGESASIRINPSDTVAHSSGDTITVKGGMVCVPSTFNASQAFVPSIFELYSTREASTDLIDQSEKNRICYDSLKENSSTTIEHNGVTFTMNSDGSVTADGTASSSANAFAFLRLRGVTVKIDDFCNGGYVLSGAPNGASSSTYRLYVYSSGYTQSEYGAGLVLPDKETASDIELACFISKGVTVDNIVFRPMICSKADWDISHKFEPYLAPVHKRSEALAELIDSGAKNRLKLTGSDVTGYGISCTFDAAAGTITLDGVNQDKKCTGSFNIQIADSTALGLVEGQRYHFSCGGYNTSDTTLGLYVYTAGASPLTQFDCYTNSTAAWESAWEQASGFRLFIRKNTVVDNVVLKPMICTEAAWEVSKKFVPYCPTPAEMWAAIQAMQT